MPLLARATWPVRRSRVLSADPFLKGARWGQPKQSTERCFEVHSQNQQLSDSGVLIHWLRSVFHPNSGTYTDGPADCEPGYPDIHSEQTKTQKTDWNRDTPVLLINRSALSVGIPHNTRRTLHCAGVGPEIAGRRNGSGE